MGKKIKAAPAVTEKEETSSDQKWLLLYPLYLDKAIPRAKGR